MKSLLPLAMALAFSGCAKADNEAAPTMPTPAIAAKLELYRNLIDQAPDVRDVDGAIETATCDSVHWSALAAVGTRPINLRAFMEGNHRLHRRPLGYPECFPDESDSTISADAYLYVLAYAVAQGDRDLAQDLFVYARDRGYRMGDGDPSRVIMRPSLAGVYARAIHAMGGTDFVVERQFPDGDFFGQLRTGFEALLQVVSILVDGKAKGGITDEARDILRYQAEREPTNPFFACAAARYDGAYMPRAIALLEAPFPWPNDRLPTTGDYCDHFVIQRDTTREVCDLGLVDDAGAEWRVQVVGLDATESRFADCRREPSPDWRPCPDGSGQVRTHSGGDFLLSAAVCAGIL